MRWLAFLGISLSAHAATIGISCIVTYSPPASSFPVTTREDRYLGVGGVGGTQSCGVQNPQGSSAQGSISLLDRLYGGTITGLASPGLDPLTSSGVVVDATISDTIRVMGSSSVVWLLTSMASAGRGGVIFCAPLSGLCTNGSASLPPLVLPGNYTTLLVLFINAGAGANGGKNPASLQFTFNLVLSGYDYDGNPVPITYASLNGSSYQATQGTQVPWDDEFYNLNTPEPRALVLTGLGLTFLVSCRLKKRNSRLLKDGQRSP